MAEKKEEAAEKKTPAKKATAKKATTTKKAPAKKAATEKKETAKKTTPKAKTTAKKAPAKKAAPKKEEAKTAEPVAEVKAEEKAPAKKPTAKKVAPKKKAEIKPLADFDWDRIGKYEESYSSAEKKDMEEVYDQTLKSIDDQEVLEGTVVSKTKRDVVINVGYKSEAVISISEFRYNPELKEGDSVEVFVVSKEDKNG